MNNWIYPEVIEQLKNACQDFLNGLISVTNIQAEIYQAERQIVALEEKELNSLLFEAENKIELLIFTVDENQLVNLVRPIVGNILNQLK